MIQTATAGNPGRPVRGVAGCRPETPPGRVVLLAVLLAGVLPLSACGDPQASRTETRAPVVKSGQKGTSRYKIGKPYAIKGTWYYPKADYNYEETGIASWYGRKFHGKKTANGEIFDMEKISAAHRTLPLPCLVRVTNLRNGRTLTIRVNDRGPFARGRIIDLSRRAAELLGFERQGTTPVRVRILARESQQMAQALGAEGPAPTAVPVVAVAAENLSSGRDGKTAPSALKPTSVIAAAKDPATQEAVSDAEVSHTPLGGRPQMYVQAGAFTQFINARRLQARLKALRPVKITQVDKNGKIFFRVRIGPLADVEAADQTLAAVFNAGIPGARTVID